MKKNKTNMHAFQRDIADHLHRYHLAVPDTLGALPSARNLDPPMVRRALRALVRNRVLGKAILYGTRPYYYLTAPLRAAGSSRAGRSYPPGPLSEQAKVRAYAMLAFCCLAETPRQKLLPAEVASISPDLSRPGLAAGYYREQTATHGRYGFACVDAGGRGRWDRIIAKLRHRVDFYRGCRDLEKLIADGHFEMAVITTLPQKAERIREVLADQFDLRDFTIRVCTVPDLLYLIAPMQPDRVSDNSPHQGFAALLVPGAWKNNGTDRLSANRRSPGPPCAAGDRVAGGTSYVSR